MMNRETQLNVLNEISNCLLFVLPLTGIAEIKNDIDKVGSEMALLFSVK
jgi:hypothetical protein